MANELEMAAVKRRLDLIILLLLEGSPRQAVTTASKIEALLDLGLTQPEVAQAIGKKLNYVTSQIAKKKKRSGKGAPEVSGGA